MRTLQMWPQMLNGDRKNRRRFIVGHSYSNCPSVWRTTAELHKKLESGNFSLAHRANYSDALRSHTSGHLRTPQQNLKDTSGISLRDSCDGEKVCITLSCSHAVRNDGDITATRSHVFWPSGERSNGPSGSLVWWCKRANDGRERWLKRWTPELCLFLDTPGRMWQTATWYILYIHLDESP